MQVNKTSGNFNGYLAWKARRQEEEDENDGLLNFRRAMDDFKINTLSGGSALTEEEKEIIREKIAAWLYENTPVSQENIADFKAAFKAFVKELYAMFGARHDLLDFVGDTMVSKYTNDNPIETERGKINFQLFSTAVTSVLNDIIRLRAVSMPDRPNISFADGKADPVPSRLLPVQIKLSDE